MGLKLKSQSSENHAGYGAGAGSIDTYIYTCPCGNGEVIRIKDDIPGFRDSYIDINCKKCAEKYKDATSLSNFE